VTVAFFNELFLTAVLVFEDIGVAFALGLVFATALALGFVPLFFTPVFLTEVPGTFVSLTFVFVSTFDLEGVLITAFTFVFALGLLVALDLGFIFAVALVSTFSLVFAVDLGTVFFTVVDSFFELAIVFGEAFALVSTGLFLTLALIVVFAFFLALVAGIFIRFAAMVPSHFLCHEKPDQNRAAHLTRNTD